MLRGSTLLHTKSYRFFEHLVRAIADEPLDAWDTDVDGYNDDGIAALPETRHRLAHALTANALDGTARAPTNTLLTKVARRVRDRPRLRHLLLARVPHRHGYPRYLRPILTSDPR